MHLTNIQTLLIILTTTYLLYTGMGALLWWRNRHCFDGLGLLFLGLAAQSVAMVLLVLQGALPDWLGILVANMLILGHIILLYEGLARFVGVRGSWLFNGLLWAGFALIHAFLICVAPSLLGRKVNFTVAALIVAAQILWLVWRRARPELCPARRGITAILMGYSAVTVVRTVAELAMPAGSGLLSQAGPFEELGLLAYQVFALMLPWVVFMMVNMRLNMTDIRRQQVLEESEAMYRRLTESTSDVIWTLDLETLRFTYVSPSVEKLRGYIPEEVMAAPMDAALTPEGAAHVRHILGAGTAEFLATETTGKPPSHIEELEQPCKDGSTVWTEVAIRYLRNPRTNRIEVHGVARDITERKRTEAVLHLRLRLLDFAADHALTDLMQRALDEIGALTHSPIGFYHFVEADAVTLSLQAWSTRTRQEFCKAEGGGMHYPIDEAGVWVDCIREGKPVIHNDYAVLPHRRGLPPGHAQVIRELVVPTFADGRIVAILGIGNKPTDYIENDVELVAYVADVIWSIVERKKHEETLRHNAEQLAARNAELDAFAHTVAHDLKSPLSGIIGYARLLEADYDDMSPDMVLEAIRTIAQAGEKLDAIIEELLLFAGVRKAEVIATPLVMGEIVEDACRRLRHLIDQTGAHLLVPDTTTWPITVGHAPWVEEVWANYISNAVKYGGTPPRIELGCESLPSHAKFYVRDHGSGLTPEEKARLFIPFSRLDQVRAQGHGLGLSIVRSIVEKLGGEVEVDSAPDQGSTFWFTLPLAPD